MASWTHLYQRCPRSCLARACSSRNAASARSNSSATASGSRHRRARKRACSWSPASRAIASRT
eukprot:1803147-Lingulodinium_polyedra.AAC.1